MLVNHNKIHTTKEKINMKLLCKILYENYLIGLTTQEAHEILLSFRNEDIQFKFHENDVNILMSKEIQEKLEELFPERFL